MGKFWRRSSYTRADYDVEGLINLLKDFKSRYPHLEVYMEPGEAVGWQTGYLVATVLDIVNNGMDLAILDTSAGSSYAWYS